MSNDIVEYYSGKGMIAYVESAMVPLVGSYISISKKVWRVDAVSYAIDHSDNPLRKVMRANVELADPSLD